MLLSSLWLCAYTFCMTANQNIPTYHIAFDNSVRQEIGADLQKNCVHCLSKYGSKRTMCMLSLAPQNMWQQFTRYEPHQRGMFLQELQLDEYETFLQRITPEQWDSWYCTLPHEEQHEVRGNYAHHKKLVDDSRTWGARMTRGVAKPLAIALLSLVTPYALIAAAGCEILVRCTEDKDPLEQKIQERFFERYKNNDE